MSRRREDGTSSAMSYTKSIVNDVVDITGWETHDDTHEFSGTSKKETVIEPVTGWLCIFKRPKDKKEHQLWAEMLASAIAGGLGWDVQRAGVAVRRNSSSGEVVEVGNILPYIYRSTYNGGNEELAEGETYCYLADKNYRHHNKKFGKYGCGNTLPLLRYGVARALSTRHRLKSDHFLLFLSRLFALDALITCTDRHPQNWGIITSNRNRNAIRVAPIYDNSSSLGCASDLSHNYKSNTGLREKIKNWSSHVRLDTPAEWGSPFIDVSKAFLETFPKGVISFRNASRIDIDEVDNLMTRIREQFELPAPYALTKKRQEHIRFMLEIGKERIDEILKDFE